MARPARRALDAPKPIDQDDIPTTPGWTLDGHQAAMDDDAGDDDGDGGDAIARKEVTRDR
jgi:hypothetical protein